MKVHKEVPFAKIHKDVSFVKVQKDVLVKVHDYPFTISNVRRRLRCEHLAHTALTSEVVALLDQSRLSPARHWHEQIPARL